MIARYPFATADFQRGMVEVGGTVFFVDSGHAQTADSPSQGRTPDTPFATLDYAIGRCTASNGDVIYVMPGHSETITTAALMDVAGVSVIGLGRGRNRPTFTGSGAIDVLNVTAANCHIENIRLLGASADVTALLNIAAADLTVEKVSFEPAETPLMSVTVASGGHRFHMKDCKWLSTANGPDCAIDFETSASDNWIVEDCFFNFVNAGLDLAVIRANADATAGGIVKNCVAIGLDAACLFVDFNSSHNVGEGLIVNSTWQHIAAATIANGVDLGGYGTSHESGGNDGPTRAAALPATTAS